MGKKSRDKGFAFQRKIAKILGITYGVDMRSTPLSGGWAKGYVDVAGDVVSVDSMYDIPYCIECKKREGWKLESLLTDNHAWFDGWWRQVLEDSRTVNKPPLLIFSRNRMPTFVACNINTGWDVSFASLKTLVDGEVVIVTLLDKFLDHELEVAN